jgi:CheY-like chemotaxis protein
MEKVFEPFFSTKPEGSGTGLGLSMVYGFVKQSGGHVKIYSEVGHGTTVRIYLPRSMESEAQTDTQPEGQMRGGSETILVVEDDEGVRETAVSLLRNLGYTVLHAPEAQSALAIIESGVMLDLLFTDVVMPGPLRSPDLASKARECIPNLAVLFTSGYTQNAIVHAGRLDDGVELLGKPYSQEALARKVRQVLGSKPNHAPVQAASRPGAASNSVAPAYKPRMLICENDVPIGLTIRDMLESRGFAVTLVGSAELAKRVYQAEKIDLLITDLRLPGTSGADLIRELRKISPRLPVLLTTGHFDADEILLDANTKVLLKPYGADILVKEINSLLTS